jgi:hypothetical protein
MIVTDAEASRVTGRVTATLSPPTGAAAISRGRNAIMAKGKRLVYQPLQGEIRVNCHAIALKIRRAAALL